MFDILLVFALVTVVVFATIVLPQILIYRAIPGVITSLREHNAVTETNAQSTETLGLNAKPMFKIGRKNYKPKALLVLLKAEIAKANENGEIYLNEEALAKSTLTNL